MFVLWGIPLRLPRLLFAAVLAGATVLSAGCATEPPATPESVQKYSASSPKSTPPAAQSKEASNLEPLKKALYADAPVTIYGLGSSVGNGASLPDPAKQSPLSKLASQIGTLTKGGAIETNLSTNGSVAYDGVATYREQIKPHKPTVLVLAYGMNDGMPAHFNSGQTLLGAVEAISTIVDEARAEGTTILIFTTPSPHTTRTDYTFPANFPLRYPAGSTVALPEGQLTTVGGALFSARHAEFNVQIIALAKEKGVALLDVVPHWVSAVTLQGEDALFDPQETVHPNLAGHTASYWAAIDWFVAGL